MNRQEFNRDLGTYITLRKTKKQPLSQQFTNFFQPRQEFHVQEYGTRNQGIARNTSILPESSAMQKTTQKATQRTGQKPEEKELERMEAKIETMNEVEDEVEQKKEGMLQGFFRKMRIFNRQPETAEEETEEQQDEFVPDEETKKVLKLTYGWLNHLPEEKIIAFKESEDFLTYKAVLAKYGLIKQPASEQASSEHEPEGEPEASEKHADEDDF